LVGLFGPTSSPSFVVRGGRPASYEHLAGAGLGAQGAIVKSIMLWGGLAAVVACASCSVEAGVGVDTGVCEEVSCGDALVNGLDTQGDALCSGGEDAAYGDVFACACGDSASSGACEGECGDNLCVDLGESGACGDCLNQLCGPEHDACAN
jgi:hypothetical protein